MIKILDAKQQKVFDEKLKQVVTEGRGEVKLVIRGHKVKYIISESSKDVGPPYETSGGDARKGRSRG